MKKLRISLLVLILPVIVQASPIIPMAAPETDLHLYYKDSLTKEVFNDLLKEDRSLAESLAKALGDNSRLKNSRELLRFAADIQLFIIQGSSLEQIEEYIKKTLPSIMHTASDSSLQDNIELNTDTLSKLKFIEKESKDMAYHGLMAEYLIHSRLNTLIKTGGEGIRGNKSLEEKTKKIISLVSETVNTAIKKAQNSCQQSFKL